MSAPELVKSNKMFGGWVRKYRHQSTELGCEMVFSVFFPPAAAVQGAKVPVVWYLSGLTCTDDNFIQKAGAQRRAAELGLALIAPDTSPRGLGVEGEDDGWDFGTGAGFYVDATADKWKQYRMYSMGGHGALVLALKNPSAFKSVSAFAPICNPTQVPWGKKAFAGYLGDGWQEEGKAYDATELVRGYSGPQLPVLMDTGLDDEFLKTQLHPWAFEEAAKGKLQLTSRMNEGYDHSYFTIASFVSDHLDFHAQYLLASGPRI
ncbi:hypothetical protein COHA_004124 [Chlorella ohadii]|uniref:S-formylglutathione hydrolase n=1 Tax=Chlorella ohadii TaxID=2649997 RepID=A0AAD5H362_9CHLO|nr:hypothetical protein COHA_004124 [Chlorella ohadii]